MNKLLKKVVSVMIGAVIAASAVPASVPAFAATQETGEAEEPLTLRPVITSYTLLTIKDKKPLLTVRANSSFNMTISVKDIKVKTSEIKGAEDIDFIKNLDAFKATSSEIIVMSQNDELLQYRINLTGCRWKGGDNAFGFMLGYSGGSDYAQCSLNVTECKTDEPEEPEEPDEPAAEPIIRIKGIEPDRPIKAGETGEFKISLRNLGTTTAYNVLAEITPSEDVVIIEGTGTQEISSIDNRESTITVKYRALDKVNSLRQSFSVSLKYYYENGLSEVSGSASVQITVPAEISTVEKQFPVIDASFTLEETEIEAGEDYSGTVTIQNTGTADIKGLFVDFSGSEDIIILGSSDSRFFNNIPVNGKQQIVVKFRTMQELTAYRQLLNYSLKYTYTSGGEEIDGTKEGSFMMFGKASSSAPLPLITSKPLDVSLEAGKKYRQAFYINNKGNADMLNVTVRVKASEGLTITDGKDSFFVEKIKAGGEKRILVSFNTNAELTALNQTLDVELEYFYEKSGIMTAGTKSGTVTMISEISTAPVLRLTGEKQESAIVPDTEYEYTITVKNSGEITVRDVYIDFTGTDALYFLDGTGSAFIDIIRPGDTADVTVKFKTLEQINGVKQTITAAMNYSYGRNNSIVQKEGTGSVVLIASSNSGQTGENAAAPNIIVGKYDIGADQIAAGEVFDLNLDFYNTSAVTGIENVVMTVNAGGDLSIYGGSSSFYYPSLAAAASASEIIQLRALPTAQTGTASVNVTFKYDYLSGETRNTISTEQIIYIPLYQPDKMTFSVTQPTYEIYAGNEVYITLSYMNKGRADAANVKAEIIGDVGALSTEKVIGTVAAGGSGSADFVITPYMAGEVSFSIRLTYEDSNMNELTQELPVTLNVMEMVWEDPGYFPMTMEEPGAEEGGFPWWIVFVGGGVLLAAGIVVIIVVVHKKKKKGKKLTAEDIDWEDDLDTDTSDSNKTKV